MDVVSVESLRPFQRQIKIAEDRWMVGMDAAAIYWQKLKSDSSHCKWTSLLRRRSPLRYILSHCDMGTVILTLGIQNVIRQHQINKIY